MRCDFEDYPDEKVCNQVDKVPCNIGQVEVFMRRSCTGDEFYPTLAEAETAALEEIDYFSKLRYHDNEVQVVRLVSDGVGQTFIRHCQSERV